MIFLCRTSTNQVQHNLTLFFYLSARFTKFQSHFIGGKGKKKKKHEPNFEIKSWNSEALLAVQLTGHQSLNFAFNLSFPNTLSLTIIWVKNKRKQRWNVNDLNACICSFVKCIMQLQDFFSSYFGHKSRGKWFTYDTVNFLSNFSAKMQLPVSISLYTGCWFPFIWVLGFFQSLKYKHQNQRTTRALFASPNSFMATFCLLKIHQQHKKLCYSHLLHLTLNHK